jgi:hypothetical protein
MRARSVDRLTGFLALFGFEGPEVFLGECDRGLLAEKTRPKGVERVEIARLIDLGDGVDRQLFVRAHATVERSGGLARVRPLFAESPPWSPLR